jgi:TrmH family RNA methyltransferase
MDVGLLRVLVLDGVQDPGNVGTMIRTAYGLGVRMTVVLDGTADPRSAKVIRASMGAVFRHRVVAGTFAEFDAFRRARDLALWVASADGEPVDQLVQAATDDIALVIGSEGHGVRDAWRSLDHVRVAVPMRGGAESLNAGVAAGILLYELTRASR